MDMLTPVNLSATHVAGVAAQGGNEALQVPEAPAAADLDNWEQENYDLSVSSALSLGFPVASVAVGAQSHVLIFGISRWKDVESGNGYVYRYGVSLRVVVQIRDSKLNGSLTIPVVAAKVQLEGAKATASLLIRGYKGTLNLPHWESFDVTSYGEYQGAVSAIQDQIASNVDQIEPELLATTAGAALIPAATSAVGTVIALDCISRGETVDDALRDLAQHTEDQDVVATVKSVYRERLNGTSEGDSSVREQARADLRGIHLRHGLWR